MPLIRVKPIEGVFDAAEKAAVIEKLTDPTVVSLDNRPDSANGKGRLPVGNRP